MPYIEEARRDAVRPVCKESPANVGELNYAISCLVHDYVLKHGLRYETINAVTGVLDCANKEFYRTVAARYEQGKRSLNGPVSPLDGAFEYQDMVENVHIIAQTEEPEAETLACICTGLAGDGFNKCPVHDETAQKLNEAIRDLPFVDAPCDISRSIPFKETGENSLVYRRPHDMSHIVHAVAGQYPPEWHDIVVMLDGKRMHSVYEVNVTEGWITYWNGGPDGPLDYLNGKIELCSAEATDMRPSMQRNLNPDKH